MAPPPTYDVKRIPAVPHPGPPPIPEQEIISKFAANEDTMKKVFDTYDFTQAVRIEELTTGGGKFTATGQVFTRPDGKRYWRVTTQPVSTLKLMAYTIEDVRATVALPLFVLTTDEITNYNFLYAGQDKLDELNTYVFQVKPKMLSRKRRFFDGVIWVDDHDLAIVKSYGKFVNDLPGNGTDLPFTMFETYRENFQEKYWLPTYITSDDYVTTSDNEELHLRLVIRASAFTPQPPSAPAAAAPSAAPAPSPPTAAAPNPPASPNPPPNDTPKPK